MEANNNETKPSNGSEEAQTGGETPVDIANGSAVEKEFEKVQKEVLYLRAEFDNYKKRILREQDQSIRFANEKLIRELAGVVGLFERGIDHGKPLKNNPDVSETDITNFVNGIEMTLRELTQLLGRFGVEFIGTVGEKFDPSRHEAISIQESSPENSVENETVVNVLQKGSMLHGRLLSPAKVVVAKS